MANPFLTFTKSLSFCWSRKRIIYPGRFLNFLNKHGILAIYFSPLLQKCLGGFSHRLSIKGFFVPP